jgi:hypothetical protein
VRSRDATVRRASISSMWIETILSREDLTQLLEELLPAKIRLGGANDDAWLALYDLSEVTLVPNTGLRVTCKAKLRWEIVSIGVPVTLHTLTVLLRPSIAKRDSGDVLAFGVEIEHADLANVPDFLDAKITDRVNRELAKKRDEMAWDFSASLAHIVALPPIVDPIEAIDVKVAWGKLRIDADALVLAVSFHVHLLREGGRALVPKGGLATTEPLVQAQSLARTTAIAKREATQKALWVVSGVAFFTGVMAASMWPRRGW